MGIDERPVPGHERPGAPRRREAVLDAAAVEAGLDGVAEQRRGQRRVDALDERAALEQHPLRRRRASR